LKNELEHIDQIFKQSFDAFEADVDPSVWSNIQNTIGSNSATTSSGSAAGKSIALKIVYGVIALGVLAAGAYLISGDEVTKENQIVVTQPLEIEGKGSLNAEAVENQENQENQEKQVLEEVVIKNISSEKITPTQTVTAVVKKPAEMNLIEDGEIEQQALQTTTDLNGVAHVYKEEEETTSTEKTTTITAQSVVEINDKKELVPKVVDKENVKVEAEVWKDDALQLLTEKAHLPILYKERIPKAFSPNGDGIRDVIRVEGENIKEFQATILNASSGKVVFEWNWIEGFWDGRDKGGSKVPKGTYMLQVIASGEDGVPLEPILQSITVY
jgi:hypothetical protein